MQIVDHADVSCLHNFFHKRFEEGEGKKGNIGGRICLWLVWVYVEKWIDDVDRQSSFCFPFRSTCTYMYINPLATQKQQVGIDDDMNNVNKGTFWHSLLFFSCSFGTYLRYQGTSYEVYLLDR